MGRFCHFGHYQSSKMLDSHHLSSTKHYFADKMLLEVNCQTFSAAALPPERPLRVRNAKKINFSTRLSPVRARNSRKMIAESNGSVRKAFRQSLPHRSRS